MNLIKCLTITFLAFSMLANCSKDDDTTPWRDKFIGTFFVSSQCPGFPDQMQDLVIAEGSGENDITVTISNVTWMATVNSATTFNIPTQDYVVSGNTLTVTGNGSVPNDGSAIDMEYTISQGPGSTTCSASGSRK